MTNEEVLQKVDLAARAEIKKYQLPYLFHYDSANQKGQELAEQLMMHPPPVRFCYNNFMQLISLNILAGQVYEPLKQFLMQQAEQTDFFCFQEVYDSKSLEIIDNYIRSNIFSELAAWLPDFQGYFAVDMENFEGHSGVSMGLAIFVKKNVSVDSQGQIFVHGQKNQMAPIDVEPPTNMQYLRFITNGRKFTIANIHGIVYPGTKLDTPDRLMQSVRIDEFLLVEPGEKILCGDFNLMPNTQSIALIEAIGMRDLIKDYNIMTTRSELDHAKYRLDDRQYFADFTFVSPGVKVLNFEVPNIVVSDHLPMKLEFANIPI